jgi:uncharacterized membrane protein
VNISADLFGDTFIWWSNLLVASVLILSLFFIHWKAIVSDSRIQHVLGFCSVSLMVAWSIRAGISDGLGIHFFLITAIHLLLGWQLAIWVACFALSGTILMGLESVEGFGINMLVSVIVPLLSNYIVWKVHDRSKATHPFSFVFLVAFLGGAMSVISSGLVMSTVLWVQNIYSLERIINEFWVFIPLIAAPEATINGMIISFLVFNHPEWVRLFDRKRYLGYK